jgi:hypothetical protein
MHRDVSARAGTRTAAGCRRAPGDADPGIRSRRERQPQHPGRAHVRDHTGPCRETGEHGRARAEVPVTAAPPGVGIDATAHPTPLTAAQQASDVGVGGAELVALPGSDHATLPACDAPHSVAEGSLLQRQRCSSTTHPSEGDGSDSDVVRVIHSHPGRRPRTRRCSSNSRRWRPNSCRSASPLRRPGGNRCGRVGWPPPRRGSP